MALSGVLSVAFFFQCQGLAGIKVSHDSILSLVSELYS